LAVFSSGGNGFSLSSLTALECLVDWTLSHRCWAAVAAPAMVGFVAALTWARARYYMRKSHALNPFNPSSTSMAALRIATELSTSRIYSVCVSLLYLLVFPCAQTALTALGCTDRREAGSDSPNPQVYLNLWPSQPCDHTWRRDILPPALLAAFFWCCAFPVASTVLLYRMHARLSQAGPGRSDSSTHLHTWSLVSELLKPYMPRLWYWFVTSETNEPCMRSLARGAECSS
jgi:hypothetical protein